MARKKKETRKKVGVSSVVVSPNSDQSSKSIRGSYVPGLDWDVPEGWTLTAQTIAVLRLAQNYPVVEVVFHEFDVLRDVTVEQLETVANDCGVVFIQDNHNTFYFIVRRHVPAVF